MGNSLRASTEGLAIVDRARQRRGWTKTSTARWWQDAHTSRATLRRFWQGDRIQRDSFIAICEAVGISAWETIVETIATIELDKQDSVIVQLDWEEAPDVEVFYGRHQELQQLEAWIGDDRCRMVIITGMAGVGKTAFALTFGDRIQPKFEYLMWRSLQTSLPLPCLLDSLLTSFGQPSTRDSNQDFYQLSHYLHHHRCLIILDGLETVLNTPIIAKEYTSFLQKLSRDRHPDRHQSCILITSQIYPTAIEINRPVRELKLQGLLPADAVNLLRERGCPDDPQSVTNLIHLYRGNPLALKLVAPLIQSVFAGSIGEFLSQNILVIGDRLRSLLKQQFAQLSELERDILYWLAIWQEPVSFSRLQTHRLATDPAAVLQGIVALEQRSLLEKWFSADQPMFTLQPVVMNLVTDELVAQAVQEIQLAVQHLDVTQFRVLRTHWLLRPGTDDIVGDRILTHLREQLWHIYGTALPTVLQQVRSQLELLPSGTGYTLGNLVALLKHLPV